MKILSVFLILFSFMFFSKSTYAYFPKIQISTTAYNVYRTTFEPSILLVFYSVLLIIILIGSVVISRFEKINFRKGFMMLFSLSIIQAIYYQYYKEQLGVLFLPLQLPAQQITNNDSFISVFVLGLLILAGIFWSAIVYVILKKFFYKNIRVISAFFIALFLTPLPGIYILKFVFEVFQVIFPFAGTKFEGVI